MWRIWMGNVDDVEERNIYTKWKMEPRKSLVWSNCVLSQIDGVDGDCVSACVCVFVLMENPIHQMENVVSQ